MLRAIMQDGPNDELSTVKALLLQAAVQGDVDSTVALGVMYQEGIGIERDVQQARPCECRDIVPKHTRAYF